MLNKENITRQFLDSTSLEVKREVEVEVSRRIFIEVEAHEDASISTISNLAFEKFVESQEGYDESEVESFRFKLVRAPIIKE